MAILWQTSDPIATSDFSIGTGLVQNTGNVELSPANGAASGRDGSTTNENVRYGYIRFQFDDLPENRIEFFGYGYGYQRAYLTIDQNGSVDIRGHNAGDIDTGIMTVVEGVVYDVELYFNLDTDEYEVRNGGSNISSGSHTQGGSLREFFVGNGSLNGSLDTTVTYDLKVFEVVIDDSAFPFAASGPSMTGSVSLDLSVAGDMLVSEAMTAGVDVELAVAGTMQISDPMSGDVGIELAADGNLLVSEPVSGDVGVELDVSGDLLVSEPMSGDVDLELDVSGEALVSEAMTAGVDVELTIAGAMEVPLPISADIGIEITAAGDMTQPVDMTGAVGLELDVMGTLLVDVTVDAVTTYSGNSPNRTSNTETEFLQNVSNYLTFFDTHTAEHPTLISQLNALALSVEFYATAAEAARAAVVVAQQAAETAQGLAETAQVTAEGVVNSFDNVIIDTQTGSVITWSSQKIQDELDALGNIDDGTTSTTSLWGSQKIQDEIDAVPAGLAPLASPALTGNPTAPTQDLTDNSTNLATTEFADSHIRMRIRVSTSDPGTGGSDGGVWVNSTSGELFVRAGGLWRNPRPYVHTGTSFGDVYRIHYHNGTSWEVVWEFPEGIGNYVPWEGGYYAGTITYNSTTYSLYVKGSDETGTSRWRTTNTSITGANDYDDGYQNTQDMLAAGSCPAATAASDGDWYLPSRNELDIILDRLSPANAPAGSDFVSGGSAAFDTGAYYWSSTENAESTAVTEYVTADGLHSGYFRSKTNYYNVRAIKRV